jgi:hypothetical protein
MMPGSVLGTDILGNVSVRVAMIVAVDATGLP